VTGQRKEQRINCDETLPLLLEFEQLE